jgi:ABC-type transport system involved in multi-copper enzyme maturation permease subunit
VTWRQHRAGLAAAFVLLGGSAILLVVNGLSMHHAYVSDGLTTCGSLNGSACQLPINLFEQHYQSAAMYLPRFFEFVPGVLGVFIGAPLVARELESGTYRFAWTQGRNRAQWIVSKLVILGGLLTLLALGFSLVFNWWYGPWLPLMGRMEAGQAYEVVGIVFAARTLFAFMLGALLGTVIRRTVPAMAATAAAWVAVAWSSIAFLRPLIETPVNALSSSNPILNGGWVIHQWTQDAAGHHVSHSALLRLYYQHATGSLDPSAQFQTWLAQHHYTQWASYQPDSRFWHFQTIEGAAYLVLALALGIATTWWVRRRTA